MSNRTRRMTRTCTITRRLSVGQSGDTAVADDLPCTNPYPASSETRREPLLATISNLYEIMTADAAIEDEDILTLVDDGQEGQDRVFHIRRAQKWRSARVGQPTIYFLVVEEYES